MGGGGVGREMHLSSNSYTLIPHISNHGWFILISLFPLPPATITDQDIDAILAVGQQKTEEFNAKLQQLGVDSLQSFAFDTNAAPKWVNDYFWMNRHLDFSLISTPSPSLSLLISRLFSWMLFLQHARV